MTVGTLARLIRGTRPSEIATATCATFATHPAPISQSVATVATVAVAEQKKGGTLPWTIEREERAAIIEHDGRVPRALADALAWMEACPSPQGIMPRRWKAAQDSFVAL